MATNQDFSQCSNDIYNYYGTKPETGIQTREIKKAPTHRVEKSRQRYFETKSSASFEFPYWYTRRWEDLEGEVPIIRRARSIEGRIRTFNSCYITRGITGYEKSKFFTWFLSHAMAVRSIFPGKRR